MVWSSVTCPLALESTTQKLTHTSQLDKLVGLAMLVAASVVFLYYTIWTLAMVCLSPSFPGFCLYRLADPPL